LVPEPPRGHLKAFLGGGWNRLPPDSSKHASKIECLQTLQEFIMRCTALLTLVLVSPIAAAGIFEDPDNLQVLPEDTEPQQLRATMRGFAMGLGVRCSFCHVGEEGEPLSTYDFASDENDRKLVARQMLQMVAAINDDFLAEMDPATGGDVGVTCVTCHRGQEAPLMIEHHLDEALADGGVVAATARYEELRAQYYGGFTFDFSEWSLLNYADTLLARGDTAAATALVETNLMHYPESEWTLMSMAQLMAISGDASAALERIEQVLAINPNNRQALEMRANLSDN
jgi:tetratricopeptide (TPR) repeat protein